MSCSKIPRDQCRRAPCLFGPDVQSERGGIVRALQVPGERYQYSIGQHLPVRSFRAAARPAPDAGFTFIVYGDMGESDHRAAKSPG